MRLAKEDTDLFYSIWRPLLQFANEKQKIHPEINAETDSQVDARKCSDIADWIWDHMEILDEFANAHPELSEDARSVVLSWKRRVRGMFFVERHLKSGSVFVGENGIYLVQGLISSFEEMFGYFGLPVVVEATLIPFREKITSDGLISVMNISVGPGIRKRVKSEYLEAKRNNRVITSL